MAQTSTFEWAADICHESKCEELDLSKSCPPCLIERTSTRWIASSQMGQKPPICPAVGRFRFTPVSGQLVGRPQRKRWANCRNDRSSFDKPISLKENRFWYRQVQQLCSLKVKHQFELGWLFDRHFSGNRSLEYSVYILR